MQPTTTNNNDLNIFKNEDEVKIFHLPKKRAGEFRTICIPTGERKKAIKKFLPVLREKTFTLSLECAHGFLRGKSPVTNAKEHIGYRFTLSFDLKDFFEHVRSANVVKYFTQKDWRYLFKCFYDLRAPQGFPSSPFLSNLAAIDLDKKILNFTECRGIKYTRYADDLTFSFNVYGFYEDLKSKIPSIVEECGFKINERKTHLQTSNFGNRMVTGISVGEKDISVSRKKRRKKRAAEHQKNIFSLNGLKEWEKLKLPKQESDFLFPNISFLGFRNLSRKIFCKNSTGLRLREIYDISNTKKTEKLSENVFATGNIVYLIAMGLIREEGESFFSVRQKIGKRSIFPILACEGIRFLVELSNEKVSFHGIRVNKIKSSCLLLDTDAETFILEDSGDDKFPAEITEKYKKVKNSSFFVDSSNKTHIKGNLKGNPFLWGLEAQQEKLTVCQI